MSWHDYQESKDFGSDPSFYALLMAAMRRADTLNVAMLRSCWPAVWDELQARYDAPGGYIPSDPGYVGSEAP